MMVNITCPDKKISLGDKVRVADKFLDRLVGLMFSKSLGDSDGLLILNCNSIHTCFMRYPIDILLLSKDKKIVKIIRDLKPWRMTRLYFGANQVLELMGGTLDKSIEIDDQLEVVCIN